MEDYIETSARRYRLLQKIAYLLESPRRTALEDIVLELIYQELKTED